MIGCVWGRKPSALLSRPSSGPMIMARGEGDGGRYGPDKADRQAHGHRVRVRGRGEVGPKEEAVALRQAQAGGPRGPKDRGGRAQQADTRARVVPRVAPRAHRSVRAARRRGRRVGGRRGAQARAAPQLEAGAHGGLLHGLRGAPPRSRGCPGSAPRT